jgi:excisionase family DNA binding protein
MNNINHACNESKKEALFLTLTETAALLGLSKATVCRAVKMGKIPHVTISRYPLVPRKWIDDTVRLAIGSLREAQA